LTDLYQLTMAQAYWAAGKAEDQACFHLFFRAPPFGGGYTIACGLEPAVDWLAHFRFADSDLTYLATLTGNDGTPLFKPEFLEYLRKMDGLQLDIDAIPEGTVVFPHEPLMRVRGSILQAQLVETALLCLVNFHTLVASKAARICGAVGEGEEVLEFGLRRAQGLDGALAATRAAYIGGCSSTSNVLAGKRFGIPVRGTHAHSWVMSFSEELDAFKEYARTSPNNCVLLVDTYDTLTGVRNAIETAQLLRKSGHRLAGIRLDSGDLSWLSVRAREMLDAAGLQDVAILASNDLDEHVISSIRQQGSQITIWGVGTKLVTAYDQPALGGVYKLAATKKKGEAEWKPCIKLSEQAIKVSNPGMLNVRRFTFNGEFSGDIIWDELNPPPRDARWTVVDPADPTRQKAMSGRSTSEDLLIPIFRGGALVWKAPPLSEVRARTHAQLKMLHSGIRRLTNPHEYPCGLEPGLLARKTELILAERAKVRASREAANREAGNVTPEPRPM